MSPKWAHLGSIVVLLGAAASCRALLDGDELTLVGGEGGRGAGGDAASTDGPTVGAGAGSATDASSSVGGPGSTGASTTGATSSATSASGASSTSDASSSGSGGGGGCRTALEGDFPVGQETLCDLLCLDVGMTCSGGSLGAAAPPGTGWWSSIEGEIPSGPLAEIQIDGEFAARVTVTAFSDANNTYAYLNSSLAGFVVRNANTGGPPKTPADWENEQLYTWMYGHMYPLLNPPEEVHVLGALLTEVDDGDLTQGWDPVDRPTKVPITLGICRLTDTNPNTMDPGFVFMLYDDGWRKPEEQAIYSFDSWRGPVKLGLSIVDEDEDNDVTASFEDLRIMRFGAGDYTSCATALNAIP